MSLKNKVVLVSGGTRGIGYAIVKGFLDSGARVVLLGSRKESVDRALTKLKNENEAYEVLGYYPDLSKENEIVEMLEDVKKKLAASVDILVNNAGISDAKSIYEYDDTHFADVMQVNVDAMFRLTRLCVPMMKEKGKGVVINTSSMVSLYAQTSGSAYPTSKFAVNGMTKSLARELGKDGIRVNAVAPGITKTDMVAALPEQMIKPLINAIPIRRIGEPEDIANAFLFLASDMASYITGEILSVDGAMRS